MIVFFSGQLRKPLVERLRRERINSSIEQLKSLLGPGLKQQPDSKLEKADILEMTVCILRRLQKQRWALDFAAVDGASQVQEAEHVLSNEDTQMHMQRRLTRCLNRQNSSADSNLTEPDLSPVSSAAQSSGLLWRPW